MPLISPTLSIHINSGSYGTQLNQSDLIVLPGDTFSVNCTVIGKNQSDTVTITIDSPASFETVSLQTISLNNYSDTSDFLVIAPTIPGVYTLKLHAGEDGSSAPSNAFIITIPSIKITPPPLTSVNPSSVITVNFSDSAPLKNIDIEILPPFYRKPNTNVSIQNNAGSISVVVPSDTNASDLTITLSACDVTVSDTIQIKIVQPSMTITSSPKSVAVGHPFSVGFNITNPAQTSMTPVITLSDSSVFSDLKTSSPLPKIANGTSDSGTIYAYAPQTAGTYTLYITTKDSDHAATTTWVSDTIYVASIALSDVYFPSHVTANTTFDFSSKLNIINPANMTNSANISLSWDGGKTFSVIGGSSPSDFSLSTKAPAIPSDYTVVLLAVDITNSDNTTSDIIGTIIVSDLYITISDLPVAVNPGTTLTVHYSITGGISNETINTSCSLDTFNLSTTLDSDGNYNSDVSITISSDSGIYTLTLTATENETSDTSSDVKIAVPSIAFTLSDSDISITQNTPYVFSFGGKGYISGGTIALSSDSTFAGFACSDFPTISTSDSNGLYNSSASITVPATPSDYDLTLILTEGNASVTNNKIKIHVLPFILSDNTKTKSFPAGSSTFNPSFHLNAAAHVAIATNWGFSDVSDFGVGTNGFSIPITPLPASDYTYIIKAISLANSDISALFSDTLHISSPGAVTQTTSSATIFLGITAMLGILYFLFSKKS